VGAALCVCGCGHGGHRATTDASGPTAPIYHRLGDQPCPCAVDRRVRDGLRARAGRA
jgi:hypothetical protein